MAKVGRPPILDDVKKREVCALIFAGCSRSVAAQYVGCSSSTILLATERDPAFAEQLRVAEISNEAGLLHTIKEQAKRSWRAAAWYLDRINPDRYGRRKPQTVTPERVRETLTMFTEVLLESVPRAEDRDRVQLHVRRLIESLRHAIDEEQCFDRRDIRREFDLHPRTPPTDSSNYSGNSDEFPNDDVQKETDNPGEFEDQPSETR